MALVLANLHAYAKENGDATLAIAAERRLKKMGIVRRNS